MKITIYQNREVYKEESKIGNDSENKVETLEFEFPEEYEDFTKYIEFQIKGEKYVDLIEDNKYVITREVAKYGKIKTQLVLKKNIENDVLIFKSNVFELNVSKSINASENLVNTVGVDLIEKIVTKNNEQDFRLDALEADNTTNKENISNLQNDNTTNKSDIKSLQDDNEVNKTDISNIKQEQTTQNINISNLQTDNTSNKSKILDLEAKNTKQDTNIQKNAESIAEINAKNTAQDEEIEQLKEKDITQDELIEQLQAENTKLKKEINSMQIPGEATGNPIHLSDSSDMECEIVVNGNAEQDGEPTPDTPIEVVTVGQNVNMINAPTEYNFTATGTGRKFDITDYELIPGTMFYNFNAISGIGTLDPRLWLMSGNTVLKNVVNKTSFTLTKEEISQITGVSIYIQGTTKGETYNIKAQPKLEPGTVATAYSPYGQGSVEIEVCNKNLAKINEINWELTENNTIKNKAKNDAKKLATISLKKGQTVKISIKLKSKPTVDSSFTARGMPDIGFIRIDKFELDKANTITYTATEDVEIIYNFWGNANSETFEFQFWAEIDEATDYIPHQSYTKALPLQKEFVKIGDYEDTFIKQDGKWYEKHCISKEKFNGAENWENQWSGDRFAWRLTLDNIKTTGSADDKGFVISNYFKLYTQNELYQKSEHYGICNRTNQEQIIIKNDDITSTADFKAYFAEKYANGTPVIVYYVLETPELIPCTAEQEEILNSFYTYKNITNISMSGIGTLKVNYKKDLETIINNLSATSVAE